MSQTMKLWKRAMEQRLRQKTNISIWFHDKAVNYGSYRLTYAIIGKISSKKENSAYGLHRLRKMLRQGALRFNLVDFIYKECLERLN